MAARKKGLFSYVNAHTRCAAKTRQDSLRLRPRTSSVAQALRLVGSTSLMKSSVPRDRLGSGVCAVRRLLDARVGVALGCDGACSSDGQDMTEAIKAAALVSTLASPDYREWLSGREALRLAYAGGAAAVR